MAEQKYKKSREIDIADLLQRLFKEWKTLLICALVFAVLGVVVALCRTKEYTTEVVLAPETSTNDFTKSLGAVGDILGGLATSSSSDAISPELYPNVFTSTTFLIDLFDTPVMSDTTYYEYLTYVNKPSFLSYPKTLLTRLIKGKEENRSGLNPFHLTKKQAAVCKIMRRNIQCVVDQRTGIITIVVKDINNVVAAIMADTVTAHLQNYITDYRTKKSRDDLEFITKLYEQAKDDYTAAQNEYAKFYDANVNIFRSSQKVKLENLEKDLELKMTLYSNLAQQRQIALQRVQERVPVFSVIQPATVPLESSSMSNKMLVMLFASLGIIIGSIWCLFVRNIYQLYKEKRDNIKK